MKLTIHDIDVLIGHYDHHRNYAWACCKTQKHYAKVQPERREWWLNRYRGFYKEYKRLADKLRLLRAWKRLRQSIEHPETSLRKADNDTD